MGWNFTNKKRVSSTRFSVGAQEFEPWTSLWMEDKKDQFSAVFHISYFTSFSSAAMRRSMSR
jgi:hypothetical protein